MVSGAELRAQLQARALGNRDWLSAAYPPGRFSGCVSVQRVETETALYRRRVSKERKNQQTIAAQERAREAENETSGSLPMRGSAVAIVDATPVFVLTSAQERMARLP